MLAENVRRNPDVVRRIVREGHEVGAHGDRHWPLPILPPDLIRRELERCSVAVSEVAGVTPVHYRPPFGLMMPGQSWFVRRLGFVPVLGDVYPEDARNPRIDRIVERVWQRLTGGSIVILHDGTRYREPIGARPLPRLRSSWIEPSNAGCGP